MFVCNNVIKDSKFYKVLLKHVEVTRGKNNKTIFVTSLKCR